MPDYPAISNRLLDRLEALEAVFADNPGNPDHEEALRAAELEAVLQEEFPGAPRTTAAEFLLTRINNFRMHHGENDSPDRPPERSVRAQVADWLQADLPRYL